MSKIVIVTGASKGIGKAIAIQLVKAGYEVQGVYNTSKSEADLLSKQHGIKFHQADLANRQHTLKLANELASLRPTALVNDAGIWQMDDLDNMEYSNWDKTLEVNLTAPLVLSLTIGKSMPSGGSIINIASTDGMKGAFSVLSYAASKAALINITKTLGIHFGPKGVRVNAIAPGWIDTAMADEAPAALMEEATPLGRKGKPEEVANLVEFLISDKASYMSSETIVLDGGLINVDYVLKKESEHND